MDQVFLEADARRTLTALLVAYVAALLVSAVALLAFDLCYLKIWPHDVMGLLDAANRLHLGQRIYVDFHSLYGPVVALIPALGLDIGLKGALVFAFDAVVVAGFLLALAVPVLSRRLTLAAALLLFVYAWLMIVVPLGEGLSYDEITWGTYYNRHCWAALIILLVFYVEPLQAGRFSVWLDAGMMALLVLFEIYGKFSFGVIALGFLAANAAVSPYNRAVSLRALGLVLAVCLVLELAFHFHAAYWRNIAEYMAKAGTQTFAPWRLTSLWINNAPLILAAFSGLLAARLAGRRSVFDVLFVVGTIGATVMIRTSIGDDPAGRLVALFVVLVCLGELTRRVPQAACAGGPWAARWAHLACLALTLVLVAPELGNRIVAVTNDAAKVAGIDRRILKLDTLPGTPPNLADFAVFKDKGQTLFELTQATGPAEDAALTRYRDTRSPAENLTAEEYMRSIVEGAALLQTVDYRGHAVQVMEMVNPFTYALGMRPVRNGYPQFWLIGPYSTDAGKLPTAEQFFSDADYVMVPRLPFAAAQLINMMKLYGNYLSGHFTQRGESPHWELWERKPAA